MTSIHLKRSPSRGIGTHFQVAASRLLVLAACVWLTGPCLMNAGADEPGPADRTTNRVAKSSAGKVAPIFDGKTLKGWSTDDEGWSVKNGMIVFEGTVPSKGGSEIRLNRDLSELGAFRFSCQVKGSTFRVGITTGSDSKSAPSFRGHWYRFIFEYDGKNGVFSVDGYEGRKAPMKPEKLGLTFHGPTGDKDKVQYRNIKLEQL